MSRKRLGKTFDEVLQEFLSMRMKLFYDGGGDIPKSSEVDIIRAFGAWVCSTNYGGGYRFIKTRVRKPKSI